MNINALQSRLKELGLDPGIIDGKLGPKTQKAVRAFQRLHGLRDDGVPGPKTQAELFPAAIADRDIIRPAEIATAEAINWPRQLGVPAFYGAMGKNQVWLQLPFAMKLAWDLRKPVRGFYVHKKVHDSAARAFALIAQEYGPAERAALGIDLFGGCLNVRQMRGGSAWSMHSWGIAIDFDPARNQLKWGRDKARLALPDALRFWQIWEGEGWLSLGRSRNYDWMHVQAARL